MDYLQRLTRAGVDRFESFYITIILGFAILLFRTYLTVFTIAGLITVVFPAWFFNMAIGTIVQRIMAVRCGGAAHLVGIVTLREVR